MLFFFLANDQETNLQVSYKVKLPVANKSRFKTMQIEYYNNSKLVGNATDL